MTQDKQPLPPTGAGHEPGAEGTDARPPARIVTLRPAIGAQADAAMAASDDDPDLETAPRPRGLNLGWLARPAARSWQPPVTGALTVIFGTAALFKAPLVLAPLAIGLALIAGFRGHHSWAVIGLGTALVGLLTSAWFWTLLGLAWLYQSWG